MNAGYEASFPPMQSKSMSLHYIQQPFTDCACGKSSVGSPSLQHKEVRDITASLISEVCSNVCTEPTLSPVTGEGLPLQLFVLMMHG